MRKGMLVFCALPVLIAVTSCRTSGLTCSGIDPMRFDACVEGRHTGLYVLENENGMEVCLCNYGARIVSIVVPDRNGQPADVTLGFDNLDDYRFVNANFGATIGRYANRIADAELPLGNRVYRLTANNGPHCLHGGRRGWQTQVFDIEQTTDSTIRFTYLSPDGEEGFPGNVQVWVNYSLTADNTLRIAYTAVTDRPTVVNPTNHAFFNLSGDPSQTALDHWLYVDADSFLPVDSLSIPSGEIACVAGSPMDFRRPAQIFRKLDTLSQQLVLTRGYDHNWILNDRERLDSAAATLYSARSGILMEVFTDAPGIQIFTANAFNGSFEGRRGIAYRNRPAVCLETQHFPDSPHHPQWPSATLVPGDTLRSMCAYRFSVRENPCPFR